MHKFAVHNIGSQIRFLRKNAGYKLVEIAEKAHVSKGLLSKVENGHTIPSLPVLLSIIHSLGMEPDSFFKSMHNTPSPSFTHIKELEHKTNRSSNHGDHSLSTIYVHHHEKNNFTLQLLEIPPQNQKKQFNSPTLQVFYLLAEKIDCIIGKEERSLEKGDSLIIQGRESVQLINKYTKPARLLVFNLRSF